MQLLTTLLRFTKPYKIHLGHGLHSTKFHIRQYSRFGTTFAVKFLRKKYNEGSTKLPRQDVNRLPWNRGNLGAEDTCS